MKANVLVADDDAELLESLKVYFKDSSVVNLLTAPSVAEAHEIILSNHIHVALIDVFFSENGRDTRDVVHVLSDLMQHRQSCYRVLITKRPLDAVDELFLRLHPYEHSVHALARKDQDPLTTLIETVVKSNVVYDFEIDGIVDVLDSVRPRLARYRANYYKNTRPWEMPPLAEPTLEEVHSLIAGILRKPRPKADSDSFRHIKLSELGRGKSTSAVFRGRPQTAGGHFGLLCIFKVGPRKEIEAEALAFDRFVRFYRGTFRRVEMLGSMLGDTLGCVCYSFVGMSPNGDRVSSLQEMINSKDFGSVRQVLLGELDPSQKEWFLQESFVEEGLAKHFGDHYRVDPTISREIEEYVNDFLAMVGGAILRVDGKPYWRLPKGGTAIDIPLPTPSDLSLVTQGASFNRYRSCITHGDMNGENLLVSYNLNGSSLEVDRVILIDYRDTGRGPVFVDFAALEASFRLSETDLKTSADKAALTDLAFQYAEELSLSRETWAIPLSNAGKEMQSLDGQPFWKAGSLLTALLARQNFEGVSPNYVSTKIVQSEYIATCFLYCLRLLGIRRLSVVVSVSNLFMAMSMVTPLFRSSVP